MMDNPTSDFVPDPHEPPPDTRYSIDGYGKIYNLGHREIANLTDDGPVIVQEKYDGSQFSFKWDSLGNLIARSKGKIQYHPGRELEEVDALFSPAVAHLLEQTPHDSEFVFRAECIIKPKHNTLVYDRVPDGYLVLFDVEVINEFNETAEYLAIGEITAVAEALRIEAAVQIDVLPGDSINMDTLNEWLEVESSLGGPKREGVVIKNYRINSLRTGRPLMGKYVSEAFKEVHNREWKGSHQGQGDIIAGILLSLNTEERWLKALQHLADDGVLVGEPKDIGPLMKEVKRDVMDEETEYIMRHLFTWAEHRIIRGLGNGLPEWYKGLLAQAQFADDREATPAEAARDRVLGEGGSREEADAMIDAMVNEGGPA